MFNEDGLGLHKKT